VSGTGEKKAQNRGVTPGGLKHYVFKLPVVAVLSVVVWVVVVVSTDGSSLPLMRRAVGASSKARHF
jgi:hypothetical protein